LPETLTGSLDTLTNQSPATVSGRRPGLHIKADIIYGGFYATLVQLAKLTSRSLQQNAPDPDTFSGTQPAAQLGEFGRTVSLPIPVYTKLMKVIRFPFQAIESLNCSIGQLFWAGMVPGLGDEEATFRM
jgi:hypothetical protein